MANRESLYDDIGSHARPSPYDDCAHLKCVVCGAPAGKKCVNPVAKSPDGKPVTRHMPCIGRIVRLAASGGQE